MRTKPKFLEKQSFKHLTPLQNATRIVAILLVFAGVFIWFVKIVF